MRHLYLYAIASLILFVSACSKDDPTTEDPAQTDHTKVSFDYNKIGSAELYYSIKDFKPLARITAGKKFGSFSYELTGSNGLKKSTDTLEKGSGTLDISGNAPIYLLEISNYKDGELTLKVHVEGPDSIILVKTQKAEYQIRDYRDFISMMPFRSGDTSDHYVQLNDIAFPDTVFTTAPFRSYISGSYDGQGFKITNLTIHAPGNDPNGFSLGLFAGVSGTVKNIRLELSSAGITADGRVDCGGLVGDAFDGTITQCSVKGNILLPKDIPSFTGGISGRNNGTTITGCSFRGRITASNVGGIMGATGTASVIDMCYAYFSFDSYAVGGIGSVYSPSSVLSISNSYVVAYDYTSPNFVAIGPVQYALTNTTVTNCFANAGTAQDGVTIFTSTTDINANLSVLEVAGKKPYKYDTAPDSPMKLWWE